MAERSFSVTGVSVSGSRSTSSSAELERWRFGVEAADGFDLVAEEVDADGTVLLGAVDVDDAAANRDLAGHLDDVDAGVADGEQMLDEHVGDVLFADAQVQRERGVVVAAEEAHAGGLDGRDDEARRVAGADLPERGGAGLLNLRVRREVFERQDIVRGEPQDLRGVERAGQLAGGEDGGVQRLGGFVVGDDDERGRLRGADEVRKIERAGGGGESGDTTTPRSAAQMATHTLKGLGVLQVRKQLADKG